MPECAATTMMSGFSRDLRSATAFFSASTAGRNRYEPMFSGFSQVGMTGVVIPTMAILTPATVFTT